MAGAPASVSSFSSVGSVFTTSVGLGFLFLLGALVVTNSTGSSSILGAGGAAFLGASTFLGAATFVGASTFFFLGAAAFLGAGDPFSKILRSTEILLLSWTPLKDLPETATKEDRLRTASSGLFLDGEHIGDLLECK